MIEIEQFDPHIAYRFRPESEYWQKKIKNTNKIFLSSVAANGWIENIYTNAGGCIRVHLWLGHWLRQNKTRKDYTCTGSLY